MKKSLIEIRIYEGFWHDDMCLMSFWPNKDKILLQKRKKYCYQPGISFTSGYSRRIKLAIVSQYKIKGQKKKNIFTDRSRKPRIITKQRKKNTKDCKRNMRTEKYGY